MPIKKTGSIHSQPGFCNWQFLTWVRLGKISSTRPNQAGVNRNFDQSGKPDKASKVTGARSKMEFFIWNRQEEVAFQKINGVALS
ncbi:hypothetical protein BTH58_05020 [Lactobacillus delbrueckii subsp. bulgaricus]|nr:hypothetical protein [Lactobacillus delbrueckii subsp. bulgaricus]